MCYYQRRAFIDKVDPTAYDLFTNFQQWNSANEGVTITSLNQGSEIRLDWEMLRSWTGSRDTWGPDLPGSRLGNSPASSCWSRGRSTGRRCQAVYTPGECGIGARGGPVSSGCHPGWSQRIWRRRGCGRWRLTPPYGSCRAHQGTWRCWSAAGWTWVGWPDNGQRRTKYSDP